MRGLALSLALALALTGCHARVTKSDFNEADFNCAHRTRGDVCLYWIDKTMASALFADKLDAKVKGNYSGKSEAHTKCFHYL